MSTRGLREGCSLLLLVLLLFPAVPASSQDGSMSEGGRSVSPEEASAAEGFSLHLEETAVAEDLSLQAAGSSTADGGTGTGAQVSELRLSATPDFQQLSQQTSQPDPAAAATPEKGKTGRWLKKHWYVPVLAAIAIGVAVGGGSDSDEGGEEDE